MDSPLERLDRASGLAIDAAVSAHHRRRLRRVGHGDQLEPPTDGRLWAAGDPPLSSRSGGLAGPLYVHAKVERRERDLAPTHHLLELRGVSRYSAALLGPLQGFVVRRVRRLARWA